MAKIKVTLDHPIQNGETITFKAPCDCTGATDGMIVHYPYEDGSGTGSKKFVFADSHNNDVSSLGNLFAKDALVAVVVNTDNGRAHILNADTNAYVENSLLKGVVFSETIHDENGSGHMAMAVTNLAKNILTINFTVFRTGDTMTGPTMFLIPATEGRVSESIVYADAPSPMYDNRDGSLAWGHLGVIDNTLYVSVPAEMIYSHAQLSCLITVAMG